MFANVLAGGDWKALTMTLVKRFIMTVRNMLLKVDKWRHKNHHSHFSTFFFCWLILLFLTRVQLPACCYFRSSIDYSPDFVLFTFFFLISDKIFYFISSKSENSFSPTMINWFNLFALGLIYYLQASQQTIFYFLFFVVSNKIKLDKQRNKNMIFFD